MRIATWNVNSLRARLDYLLEWLERDGPEVVCLQETKVEDDKFPRMAIAGLGYEVAFCGQKTYNGVATLFRQDMQAENPRFGLDDADLDRDRRVVRVRVAGIDIINVYVPNGKSTEHPDYHRKLRFLGRLREILIADHAPALPLVLCGDFNVAPTDLDVHDPVAWGAGILCSPAERAALAHLLDWGLADTYRHLHPEGRQFTWWDYRGAAFRLDQGLRIDLILSTSPLLDRCEGVATLREERKVKGKERWKPSDHAPVVATFTP